MKRKLNENDVPESFEERAEASDAGFNSLGLDPRLLQAIAKQDFSAPTPIQLKAIPLALTGKNILARSQTGSGKTLAYVLPILHSILSRKVTSKIRHIAALILVPSRELAQQVSKVLATFSIFCAKDIRTVNLTQKIPDTVQRTLLAESPDIIVTTPARAAENLRTSALSLEYLTSLVIDEADLVLSYGYDEDLQLLSEAVPTDVQTSLMSATLTSDVDTVKALFCRDSEVLDLQEASAQEGGISQYTVRCSEDDKFLLVYVIFKLKLVKGKCIIFVGDIDRCYRVKLFLEQFGIRSCVLNSELPVNSRLHVVEEFNKGVYDIIVASDEHEVMGERQPSRKSKALDESAATKVEIGKANDKEEPQTSEKVGSVVSDLSTTGQREPEKKRRKKGKRAKEYGVSRGIDFQNVACVLNFDFPTSSKSYIHRIGRTARAGKTGMALSFVVPSELYHQSRTTSFPTAEHDEAVASQVVKHQERKGKDVKAYHFDMKQVDSFRYRMNDALRAVTRVAIREARTRELRQELLKSEKLKRHFEENPDDLHHLRHDGELRAARIQPHLKHVPDYLMPSNGKEGIVGDSIGFVALRRATDNRIRKAREFKRGRGKSLKGSARRSNPLKTFSTKGKR